ncbi:MAG: methylated-DNA--[protein]-cysteine S-methyltransferase [Candidatus Brocadiia bacterium]
MSMSLRYAAIPSPLGRLYAAFGPRGLVRLVFGRRLPEGAFLEMLGGDAGRASARTDPAVRQLADELARYFRGEPDPFATPLDLRAGTPFQQRVWRALRRIPFGEARSYGAVARSVGSPRGARAVGQAAGSNPAVIVVPCHRVVRASGALGGFGSGLDLKRRLLRHEREHAPSQGPQAARGT